MAGKEAVVFIIDSNVTMNMTYPKGQSDKLASDGASSPMDSDIKGKTTRLECAKKVVQTLICNLMVQSKSNEACVVVLKTSSTKHHLHDSSSDEDADAGEDVSPQFRNITLLSGDGSGSSTGLARPNPTLLRQIDEIQSATTSSNVTPSSLRGDFLDGLIIASDALRNRTKGKKYRRRIILITDAEHEVVGKNEIFQIIDSLRDMECQLQVIGLDFEKSKNFPVAAEVGKALGVKKEQHGGNVDVRKNSDDENDDEDDNDDSDTETSSVDEDEPGIEDIKRGNEEYLTNLTRSTGGFVVAAHEIRHVLDAALGRRVAKSIKRKFKFKIAPGLEIEARFSLLLSKQTTPTLKKQVVMVESDDSNLPMSQSQTVQDTQSQLQAVRPRVDASGEEMTMDIQTIISHWDPENEEREVHDIAQAYRYGADLVPIGGFDMQGLLQPSEVQIKILGYMDASHVPVSVRIGPPYAISGSDSRRACASISALSRALYRMDKVAIATLVKSKDADPILVGLFPLELGGHEKDPNLPVPSAPLHLVFMELPFQGDTQRLNLQSFDPVESEASESQASDGLIDALMLDDDTLNYRNIPNPYIRAFHKTVANRSLDPDCPVVALRPNGSSDDLSDDPMATPKTILARARPALEEFRARFPLAKQRTKETTRKRKGPTTFRDLGDGVN